MHNLFTSNAWLDTKESNVMPTEVIVWVFPGVLFLVTVLVGVIFRFNREEFKDLKETNEEQNKRFLALESKIEHNKNDIREEAQRMVRESQQRSEKDIELLRSDMREQMAQVRELMRSMEQNILNQMKFFHSHKE